MKKIFILCLFINILMVQSFAADFIGVIRQKSSGTNETTYMLKLPMSAGYGFVYDKASDKELSSGYCVIKVVNNKVVFKQFEDTLGVASRVFDAILLVDVRYPNKINISDKSHKAKIKMGGNWWEKWIKGE